MTTYSKYYLYKRQETYDSGVTWIDTLETVPSGSPIATYDTLAECEAHNYSLDYLTFVAQESGRFLFTPRYNNVISYSLDSGTTWTEGSVVTVSSGDVVMWKGEMEPFPNNFLGIGTFSSNGRFIAQGNIMSLLYGDNFIGETDIRYNEAFATLFMACTTLTSAENLILPATTLAERCYYRMFLNCTSLTTAPQLPATTLVRNCYEQMFRGCTSLTTAPVLSSTTLALGCYEGMFEYCTSLTTAPSLPATTLADMCYTSMFFGCTSLTAAPVLQASIMRFGCYEHMFYGCTSLTTAPVLSSTTLAEACYFGMFQGCTSLTTAPELPATTLADNCYMWMFAGCTSLTTAPELLATTLVNLCYYEMFSGCTSLNYIKCVATDISATNCTYNWVNGVASAGTFIRDCDTQWSSGNSGIPNGWNVSCPKPFSAQYLTFVAEESGTFGFRPKAEGNTLYYSTDGGETWTTLSAESTSSTAYTPTIQASTKLLLKGTMVNNNGIGRFYSTGRFSAEGNIMSLLYGDNFEEQTSLSGKNSVFTNLFYNCRNLISAKNMILPATTLANYCYSNMFTSCTSLTTAPSVLPATTLANYCYQYMFYGCSALTAAPSLLATTLASNCYEQMFYGCSALTTAPQLPATTLASDCYSYMFYGCSALTTAPQLPATTLAFECYGNMFNNCTSLTTAPQLLATTLVSNCYISMFANCSGLTTAPTLSATTLANYCYSAMFAHCTSLTTAPQLPATTLAERCYNSMFRGCTSLTTAPTLSATTLANACYYWMFYNCSNLSSITCLATDISAWNCTYEWVNGVAANGTFIRDCNTNWSSGNSGIPNNWQDNCSTPPAHDYSQDYLTFVATESGTFTFTPQNSNVISYSTDSGSTWTQSNSVSVNANDKVLWKGTMTTSSSNPIYGIGKFSSSGRFTVEGNAMSLYYGDNFIGQTDLSGKDYAFKRLFSGCTTLTSAENMILPATTLSQSCYGSMFEGCSSLTTAPQLLATTLADSCYIFMFEDCSSLTTAPILPATTLAEYCYYQMFRFCSSLSAITCLATDISASYCTDNWVNGVAASGTFTKAANMSGWGSCGTSKIPCGWTVVDAS